MLVESTSPLRGPSFCREAAHLLKRCVNRHGGWPALVIRDLITQQVFWGNLSGTEEGAHNIHSRCKILLCVKTLGH